MTQPLSGKRALITGGSHGIGLAIARKLSAGGAELALLGRNRARLEAAAQLIPAGNDSPILLQADVLDKKSISEAIGDLLQVWPGVDILINNVGGGGRWGSDDLISTNETIWDEVYQKNAGATIQFTRLLLPYMKKNSWGRVVTITSIYGEFSGGRPWFNLAKVAQKILMKNLAGNKDFARHGITFNSVAPGAIYIEDTGWDTLKRESPEQFQAFSDSLPLGRLGTPQEVASVVAFICSEEASLLNGASIVVDGGETALLN